MCLRLRGVALPLPRPRRWLAAGAFVLALIPAGVWLAAPAADAHAFLVRTSPAQGARLASAPGEVSLEFSEAFAPEGFHVELVIDGTERLPLIARRELGGRVLRGDVPVRRDGVYVATWSVVADDGHQTVGEFAFAAGRVRGRIPSSQQTAPPASPARVAAGWLFFAG
ncbi:MAG: copper resistance CopC family protein, partial [Acidimicrobiales bacterium]